MSEHQTQGVDAAPTISRETCRKLDHTIDDLGVAKLAALLTGRARLRSSRPAIVSCRPRGAPPQLAPADQLHFDEAKKFIIVAPAHTYYLLHLMQSPTPPSLSHHYHNHHCNTHASAHHHTQHHRRHYRHHRSSQPIRTLQCLRLTPGV